MLPSVVNSRHARRRPVHPLQFHRHGVAPVTASPLSSALSNHHTHNIVRIRSYGKWQVSPSPHNKDLISYSRSLSTVRALRSLFSLFATRVFHNSFAHRRFRTLSQKCRVSPSPPPWFFKSYLNFDSSGRSYRSFLPLFAPRVFPNSFIHNRFRTLSIKCRGVPLPFTIWNRPSPFSSVLLARLAHQFLVTIHFPRLTPSASADSINLHPADRSFNRQSHPRGGGIP
jgi:hypothetical protein